MPRGQRKKLCTVNVLFHVDMTDERDIAEAFVDAFLRVEAGSEDGAVLLEDEGSGRSDQVHCGHSLCCESAGAHEARAGSEEQVRVRGMRQLDVAPRKTPTNGLSQSFNLSPISLFLS